MAKRVLGKTSFIVAVMAALTLAGCGASKEFRAAPQEGAKRTGTYPIFGRMPKAAAEQFTPEEQQALTGGLDGDRTRLKVAKNSGGGLTASQAAALRKQAQAETEATLKEIEAGSDAE